QCSTLSCWLSVSVFSHYPLATFMPAIGFEETSMIFDYSLAALVTAGLMIYLVYALLKPERL
ncbi:MAG: K(+)-transporting ATPase subunit F, partial [Pseudolabrys sp.]